MPSFADEKAQVTRGIFMSLLDECIWPIGVGARKKARLHKAGKAPEPSRKPSKADPKSGAGSRPSTPGDEGDKKKRGRPPKPKAVVPAHPAPNNVPQALLSSAIANATQRLQRQQSQTGSQPSPSHTAPAPTTPHPLSKSVIPSSGSSLSSSPAAPLSQTQIQTQQKKVKRPPRSRRSSQASSSSESEDEGAPGKVAPGRPAPVTVLAKKRRVARDDSDDDFVANGSPSQADSSSISNGD